RRPVCVSRVLLVVHSLVIRIGVVACHINYAPPCDEFSDAKTFATMRQQLKMCRSNHPNIPGSTGANPSGQLHIGDTHWRHTWCDPPPQSFSLSASMCIVVGPHNRFQVGSCVWLNVCYCRCLWPLAMACMYGGRIYNAGGRNRSEQGNGSQL
ncbi:hypothetical protein EDB83DRAFT_2363006, partial [Lactarius deliciosus]